MKWWLSRIEGRGIDVIKWYPVQQIVNKPQRSGVQYSQCRQQYYIITELSKKPGFNYSDH